MSPEKQNHELLLLERQKAVIRLRDAVSCELEKNLTVSSSISPQDTARQPAQLDQLLWDTLLLFERSTFYTAKGLAFTYIIKGNEMFVSRKDKSITRSTVLLAFHTALKLLKDGPITGPKKLGTFGASYLYPIFCHIGIIKI